MIENSLNKLKSWYDKRSKTMVALSGGVDSCLVAYLSRHFLGKENSLAVIGDSPSLKRRDFDIAKHFCTQHDIAYTIIHPNELSNPSYAANPANRCYYCKSALYDAMLELKSNHYQDFTLLNGNNYDDRGDYRPGMEAAKENDSYSPLLECEITKQEVRALAKHFNLEVWDKPASPCLSSRFPYGESINKEKLSLIENAESFLYELGYTNCRVRYFNGTAKIEVPSHEIKKVKSHESIIDKKLIQLGFKSIEIDSEGFVSGKLNRVLDLKLYK